MGLFFDVSFLDARSQKAARRTETGQIRSLEEYLGNYAFRREKGLDAAQNGPYNSLETGNKTHHRCGLCQFLCHL